MSQGPLCPNLTRKFQAQVSQMANPNLSCMILLGGLSVNLNHLKAIKNSAILFLSLFYHFLPLFIIKFAVFCV